MKLQLFILTLFIILTNIVLAQHECKCAGDRNGILFKNRVWICGDSIIVDPTKFIVNEMYIKDCKTDSEYVDNVDDLTATQVQVYKDSVVLTELTWLPDSSSSLLNDTIIESRDSGNSNIYVPLSSRVIKIDIKGNVVLSKERFCFNHFDINPKQVVLVSKLCDKLEEKIAHHDSNFSPYDESSMHLLFLGAISGSERAAWLFNKLPDNFYIVDELYEEWAEIPFDYIMDNRKRK